MTDDEYRELIEIVRRRAAGCCGDDSWRGRFCQYHGGYVDGYVDAMDADGEHEL